MTFIPTRHAWLVSLVLLPAILSAQPATPPAAPKSITAADCTAAKLGTSIPVAAIGEPVTAVTLDAPVWHPEAGPLVAYCSIDGSMAPVDPAAPPIRFRVAFPSSWAHRAAQLGGGGNNGIIPLLTGGASRPGAPLLSQGFVTYGSDSGHQSTFGGGPRGAGPGAASGVPPAGPGAGDTWTLNDEAMKNLGYMQMKKTHDAAMVLIERLFATRPRYSYYLGSSQGGRESLMVAQRYPADYDGIAAQVPIVNFSSLMLAPEWIRIQEKPAANWVPPAKVNAIRGEFMRQCDKLDGLADGVINNYLACRAIFNVREGAPNRHPWTAKRCPNNVDPNPQDTSAAACLTDGQIATLEMVYSPYVFATPLANGVKSFGMWVPNTDPSGSGLIANVRFRGQEGAAADAPMHSHLGVTGVTGYLMRDLAANPLDYVEGGPLNARRTEISPFLDATNPDLSAFQKRGGKLIVVIGTNDTLASPGAQLDYYQSVLARMGRTTVDTFARLWVLPQADHGLSGRNYERDGNGKDVAVLPIPNTYDRLGLLVDWVERGKAPGRAVTVTAGERSLPMCSYPEYPKYVAGPTGSASSYVCADGLVTGLAPAPPFRNPALPVEERITNLLSLMSVDEKVDALGSFNSGVASLGVPAFGSSEGIHGLVQRGAPERGIKPTTTTQFPQPPGMGATWNPELVRKAGGVQGAEGRYISQLSDYRRSLLVQWGPQADLMRDPRWGRSEEVYGEDPFFNGTMSIAFARGIQGDDPKYWQAAPLLKHFLANSNENGRMSSNSVFDERLFWEYYSLPFRMTFQATGANAVMASYNAWNGTPMTIHPLLREILIGQWGVQLISGDGGAVQNLWEDFKVVPDHKAAVVASLKAGINQFLDRAAEELRAAVNDGLVTAAELDEGLRRKFRLTFKLGLLDPPEMVPYAKAKPGPAPWESAEHLTVSKTMALESIVLLKNAAKTLPLRKSGLKSIAVIGPRADGVYWDWYGGTPPHAITPLQGIRDAVGPNVTVNYAADDEAGAAVKAASASDVAIVVVGNHPTCGPNMGREWTRDGNTVPCKDPGEGREGRDRETLALAQEDLVRKVLAANPKTVMVLVSSFPYTINWSQEHVPAILQMAHSSQDQGWALAQVLFGDYNPGGHTIATWPASEAQLPPMMDYDIRHGRTYMYLKTAPLYPFGHGLSYTTFQFAKLRTDKPSMAADGTIVVSVDVTNTGTVAGDAVPQLYVKHTTSKVERPAMQLVGFSRVHLAPGQTKTVQMRVKASQLAYWDAAKKSLEVEPESIELLLGASAADIRLRATAAVR